MSSINCYFILIQSVSSIDCQTVRRLEPSKASWTVIVVALKKKRYFPPNFSVTHKITFPALAHYNPVLSNLSMCSCFIEMLLPLNGKKKRSELLHSKSLYYSSNIMHLSSSFHNKRRTPLETRSHRLWFVVCSKFDFWVWITRHSSEC